MKKYLHLIRRKLAKIWLEINLQLTIVGVTGSYGKTSTVNAIAAVLSAKYSVNKTDLNLDTKFNLPITILKTKTWNEILVLEYGIDHLGEMDCHLGLVKPRIAVLTGITFVHTDEEHLKSIENVVSEKRKLVEALPEDGLAIFNYDDEYVRRIGGEYRGRKKFYGLDKKADIRASDIEIDFSKTRFKLHDGDEETEIEAGLLGYPAVYTCLAAWAVGKEQKVEKSKMLRKLKDLKPLKGRFSVEPGPLKTILVNDCRRANLASTIFGLRSLKQFTGRKIVVLGEMGEVGENSKEVHERIGKEIAGLRFDFLIGIGPLTRFSVDEAQRRSMKKEQAFWVQNVEEGAKILKNIVKEKDILYLKASLLRHLERIILLLEGKNIKCQEVACHYYGQCTTCPKISKLLE